MMIQLSRITASILLLLLYASSVLGQQEALDEARALWEGVVNGLDGEPVDYNYAYLRPAETLPQFEVLVRNQTEVSAYTIYDPPEDSSLKTVEQLFDEFQSAIDNSHGVEVYYDPVLGYPISWNIQEDEAEDDAILFGGQMEEFTFFPVVRKDYFTHSDLWNSQGSSNYDYTIDVTDMVPKEVASPKRISVRNGIIQQIVDIESGNVTSLELFDYPTVEDVFDIIDRGLNRYFSTMEVSYNNTFGFPSSYVLQEDIFVADGASVASISDVEFISNIAKDAQEMLDTNKALWESHNLTEYAFGVQKVCLCEFKERISVHVTNGQVTSMMTRLGDTVTEEDTNFSVTIGDIFDIIQTAISEGYNDVVVTYDENYGFPVSAYLDEFGQIVDEEVEYKIDYLAPISSWQSHLNEAKALWNSQGLKSYNYTYQRSCECPDEDTFAKLVEVVDNVVVAVDGVAVTSVERSATTATVPPTIDGLFDAIQDGINRMAFYLNVGYHPTYGYPNSIYIDYDEKIADDELIVSAKLEDGDDKPTGAPGGTAAPTSVPTSAAVNQQIAGRMMSGLVATLLGLFLIMV
eukprot:scaffold6651_cov99-Cylindrotheca_fusiformis.AAC.3